MPDPILYLKAFVAVVFASAIVLLACWLVTRRYVWSLAASCVLAASVGLVIGYDVLLFLWTWPPANAINRFLMIVLPGTVIVELLTAVFDAGVFSRSLIIVLRIALYACAGRVLLHDSVYLAGVGSTADAWTVLQSIAILSGGFVALIAVWSLLCRLSQRSAPHSITLSLAMTILSTGLATMMAGYIKGGVAAIPLSAALAGIALVSPIVANRLSDQGKPHLQGIIGIGVMGLFSLLCIGHYFGQLSGPRAVVIFLTPLLCWVSEFPGLRSKPPFQKSAARLIAVTIPLVAVLFVAKRDFDQKMAPLLAGSMPCEKRLSRPDQDRTLPEHRSQNDSSWKTVLFTTSIDCDHSSGSAANSVRPTRIRI